VSLRLEMLQIARLASGMLNESAELVKAFILSHQNADGGFRNRDGISDLYYTVFAIDGLSALQAELPLPSLQHYLGTFGKGLELDFVHCCCLARARAAIRHDINDAGQLLVKLEDYRTPDGGYNQKPGAVNSTAYGCLLAYGAYADYGLDVPGKEQFTDCLNSLQAADGGWGNEPGMAQGTVSASAAAIVVSRSLQLPIPFTAASWLIGCAHPDGGFKAFPDAPMPDLLSTAVSLHALEVLQADYSQLREPCLDFVDSLWVNNGGFHGHWADDDLDLEYTYYALLALGHLSL